MSLSNKKNTYALITGGSSGIGLAFVNLLAEKGYNICIVSNQEQELNVLKHEIAAKYNVKCITLCIDLAQDNAAQDVYIFCKNELLSIEVLINNAGFLIAEEFINVSPQKINALLKLHTLTPTLLAQYLVQDMILQGKGYILNVSSSSAHMPYPLISLYGPTKIYIRNFTKAIRNELLNKNIYISCILPGAVDTNLYQIDSSLTKLGKALGIIHSPQFIAKKGLNILFKNKGESVPGFINKLSLIFLMFVPDFIIRFIFKIWKNYSLNKNG